MKKKTPSHASFELLEIMDSNTQSEIDANKTMEKEVSFQVESSSQMRQRSASPEYDPKAGENRLRPAGGR